METVAKDKKDTAYVLTDIATSAALFGSFVLIKLKILMPVATIVISLVPWIILQYKKRNKFDKPVFERFGLLLISLTTIYLIIHNLLKKLIWLSNEVFLISMLSIMIISYSYYIFKFYNENSKDEDERIFGQIKKVEKS